ncbi:MAG: Eco57I restriction-modification methylase domain-containing protein, partial [Bacteroidales bacterium]|nr:Eco57I restriction-modification methylase domain-containing protein [Bacteroidales bacterium]
MLLSMVKSNYNPDVLNCIANLSNDEVFTPPELANRVLDLLPQELFQSPDSRFLDPFTKSGVFLREIVKRLDRGLEQMMPDRQIRIDHILHNQIFGIAITELTSYLSRRSLYCSKHADGKYSVSRFNTESGNILYANRSHTWENGKCKFCGASQQVYDRGSEAEQYAYMFIHTDNPKQFFGNMKFDVIIGNPPYQLNDGGGTGSSATPLYHKFIEQAQRLKPRYLSMIIPSRWYSGGKGLDEFRDKMLKDKGISHLVDYFDSTECFPGVDLSGGVCFFLWEREYSGPCEVTTIRHGKKTVLTRPLLEPGCDSFVRFNEAVSILQKIRKKGFKSFEIGVSPRKPFGDIRP